MLSFQGMMAKMGRPLKGMEKRDKRLEVRLTATELGLLNQTAKDFGLTRVDTMVKAIKLLSESSEAKR